MRAHEIHPSKLVIFDIDDTLVHTQTKVHVIRDGQLIKSLNSHDFTHYKLQPGESFDFGDFANAREFFTNAKPIIPMINQLKHDIATGNKVVMVTARADFNDKELFLDTFRKYGINMNKVHVYRAGNMTGKIQTEEKKKIIIRNLLNQGNYTKAIMYDDAVPNLQSFVELKKEYPHTKFYAWHVSLEGEASEYQRTNEMKANEFIYEGWSAKYKKSINCSHPKGFSQKAHCAGKSKHTESVEMEMVCESCGMCQTHGSLNEIAKGAKDSNGFTKCWPGKHAAGTRKGKNGGQVRNCVPNESVEQGVAEGKINPAGLNHTQQIGDYVYRAKALTGSDEGEIEMTAYDGKKSIADTVFMPYGSGGRMISGQTYVHPAYRGKGVAAGMYAYLRMLGFKIEPSGIRTDAGKAMWDKWEKTGDAKYLSKGVAEGVPQPGPSSGAPKQFGPDAKIQTRQMTVKDIISSVPGVPYYNNVVDDWDAKDYSWGVTKKVIEYATYLKDHPESLSKLPPAIVLNGKFEDGAHRVSAIWLLQQRMDPKNPLWKNAKLNVQFVKQGVAEGREKFNTDLMKPGFRWSEEINGITYRVRTQWDNMPEVVARVNNREVGRATFIDHHTRSGLESVSTYVSPNWQGHGIAKNMYAVIRMLGANIQPSATQTAMGKDMWAKWKKGGDTKHLTSMNAKMDQQGVAEDWNKVNHHDKTNGLSQKAVNAYRHEHPGSHLQTAVTTKPSKLKKGSKAAKRRKSFCARMSGNKGPMKKPNGKPTPKALALRRWNCESIEQMQELIQLGETYIKNLKKAP